MGREERRKRKGEGKWREGKGRGVKRGQGKGKGHTGTSFPPLPASVKARCLTSDLVSTISHFNGPLPWYHAESSDCTHYYYNSHKTCFVYTCQPLFTLAISMVWSSYIEITLQPIGVHKTDDLVGFTIRISAYWILTIRKMVFCRPNGRAYATVFHHHHHRHFWTQEKLLYAQILVITVSDLLCNWTSSVDSATPCLVLLQMTW